MSNLVDGNIPAGEPCLYLDDCKLRNDNCPSANNLKQRPFSCAAARAHAMMEERPNRLLASIVKKDKKEEGEKQ